MIWEFFYNLDNLLNQSINQSAIKVGWLTTRATSRLEVNLNSWKQLSSIEVSQIMSPGRLFEQPGLESLAGTGSNFRWRCLLGQDVPAHSSNITWQSVFIKMTDSNRLLTKKFFFFWDGSQCIITLLIVSFKQTREQQRIAVGTRKRTRHFWSPVCVRRRPQRAAAALAEATAASTTAAAAAASGAPRRLLLLWLCVGKVVVYN